VYVYIATAAAAEVPTDVLTDVIIEIAAEVMVAAELKA
jgi:hypothetical protein